MAAAYKTYNRNASSLEEAPPKPTYAETVLHSKDFQFQVRGFMPEPIDLRALSKVDVGRVMKEVDLEVLQELLPNITFGQITEDDFDVYSSEWHISLIVFAPKAVCAYLSLNSLFADDCFIKLFQISQLTIEHLLDSQDTLCGHLNHLAKKYAEKKREIQSLSTNLSRQDAVVATLRDELHYLREELRIQQVSPKDVLDPSLYPSQEKRDDVETPPAGDVVSSDEGAVSESPKQTDYTTKDDTIQLNVIVSSLGKHLSLHTHPSTTIEELVEQLIMELLPYASAGATWLINFKGQRLNDSLQTIQDAGIDAENNGLVLEIIPRADVLHLELNELVSAAKVAHHELVEASRTLQHQALFQDKVFESQLDLVLNEIRRGFSELALIQVGRQHDNNGDEGLESSAQLNIGEIESDHDEEPNTVAAVDSIVNSEENAKKCQNRFELWIDTKAEYDPLGSSESFHPESKDSLGCTLELKVAEKANDEGGDEDAREDGVFPLPEAHSLQNESLKSPSEDRISTPNKKDQLDQPGVFVNDEAARNEILQPALVSMPTPSSLTKIHDGAEYFHFNGVESDDCVSVNILNTTYDSNNDLSKICGFEIKQSTNQKDVTLDDMHSIEVSQSEFNDVVESTDAVSKDPEQNKLTSRKNAKQKSIKKMLPKWMKFKKKNKSLSREKGGRYGV